MLRMRQAVPGDMEAVLQLYDGVINRFQAQTGTTAWRKGVYPAEADFQKAIGAGTLYVGELEGTLAAGMIITQGTDKTYGNPPWRVDAADGETAVIHTLGVSPDFSGRGLAWEMLLGGVELVRWLCFRLARGRGAVDIIAVGKAGGPPPQAVLDAAQAVVDRERPVGADARVLGAEAFPVDVSARVALLEGASLESVRQAFTAALENYLRQRALRTRTVSCAQALRLLLDCGGVADVTDFTLCGGGTSVTLPERAAGVVGTLEIEEAGP